ncbi:DOT1-domain-containing protein [Ganoderma leucocontextum]|nr:DOT1-domain-containing protein [Ganoderma leucocontextum]
MLFTPTTTMSSSSFFSTLKFSSSGSSTLVTARVTAVPGPHDPRAGAPTIKVTAQEVFSSTPSRDLDAFSKRKSTDNLARKAAKKRRVSPPQDAPTEPRTRASRTSPIASGSSRYSSRASSLLSAESASTPSTRATSVASVPPAPPPRECWIDENGKPGDGFLSSEVVVRNLMKGYKQYFNNSLDPQDKSFDPHPTDYPKVDLEYPNTDAQESFILLAPKDKDHYNPIMCLESTLYTIIQYYLTPAQASLFGTLPKKDVTDDDKDKPDDAQEDAPEPPYHSDPASPYPTSDAPSPPSSEVSIPSSAVSCSSLSSHCSLSSLSATSISSALSLSSICALSCYARKETADSPPSVDYLRLLRRAIKQEDGLLFVQAMGAINTLLSLLKYPPLSPDPFDPLPSNELRPMVRSWTRIPKEVVHRIVDETYQRAVGPHIDMLKRYEAFSSEVYGELMPEFVTDLVRATGLTEESVFLDLGSALETGCTSYGIEIMPGPAKIARSQLEQFKTRCRMWGVRAGRVDLEEGDMLRSTKADELVKTADVVLVNNKVFLEPLNEALRQKFLDLKEGAIVVSLKCLMGSGRAAARERSASPALKERNLDDIGEIFTVTARPYRPGSVSWGGGGGEYFLQRMNREDYARRKMLFETSRAGSARVTRSRR